MGLSEDLNRAGLLAIGLKPQWVDQADYTGAPTTPADGVYLEESPVALFWVRPRRDTSKRDAVATIDTYDLAVGVYTVTVDGNDVDYDASVETPSTNDELRQGIVDAITNDVTVGALVTATDNDAEESDTILLVGKSEDDYSFDVSVTGGTGAMSGKAAAASFDVRIYATPNPELVKSGSTGDTDGWVKPLDADYAGLDYSGFVERLDIAGLSKAYIELRNVKGDPGDGGSITSTFQKIMVGSSVLEAT